MGEMDTEFSLDGVADLEALFARRAAAAASARHRFARRPGLSYAPGPDRTLDFYPADRRGGAPPPVNLFIHGGFWRSLDAALFAFLAGGFVPEGAALAVIDYPLMPSVRMAEVVDACTAAVGWMSANAAALGCDPARLFISGNSAGGHLVAEILDRPAGARVAAGTAISGVFDLEPVTRSFQNDSLGLTPAEVAAFSPLARPLALAAPLLVAVGARETGEFLRQSREFAARVGAPCLTVPDTDHITILLDALAVRGNVLNRAVLAQMGLGEPGGRGAAPPPGPGGRPVSRD